MRKKTSQDMQDLLTRAGEIVERNLAQPIANNDAVTETTTDHQDDAEPFEPTGAARLGIDPCYGCNQFFNYGDLEDCLGCGNMFCPRCEPHAHDDDGEPVITKTTW